MDKKQRRNDTKIIIMILLWISILLSLIGYRLWTIYDILEESKKPKIVTEEILYSEPKYTR